MRLRHGTHDVSLQVSLLASVDRAIQNSYILNLGDCSVVLGKVLAAAETETSWELDSDASKQLLLQFNGHISQ